MVYHIARVKEEPGYKVLTYDVFVLTLSIYSGMVLMATFVFLFEVMNGRLQKAMDKVTPDQDNIVRPIIQVE